MLFLIDNMDVVIARWEDNDGGIGLYSRGIGDCLRMCRWSLADYLVVG